MVMQEKYSEKSRLVVLLLCFFLGMFGVHRFFVGKIVTGILMLITLGCFGIWTVIDLISILLGIFRDSDRKFIFYWFEPGSLR